MANCFDLLNSDLGPPAPIGTLGNEGCPDQQQILHPCHHFLVKIASLLLNKKNLYRFLS